MRGAWTRAWARAWARAPRQLRVTREGKILVVIAFAAGLAAINTGNNLLFLGWGMVLSAIVISGVLSEATLRAVQLRTAAPEESRAGEAASFPLLLTNPSRRFPALGVEIDVRVGRDGEGRWVPGPYQLRLAPGGEVQRFVRFVPERRGLHHVSHLRSRTAYPFGFFEKSRRMRPATAVSFWVAPPAVDVSDVALQLQSRLGDEAARRAGPGDDFFSLRPYRTGDDPRHIHWRRSARTGRWVVVESEAHAAREVRLELHSAGDPAGDALLEHGIAVLGSLAERLLEGGYRVGIAGPGTRVEAGSGPRHRWTILLALARMDPTAPLPSLPSQHGQRRTTAVALCLPGAAVSSAAFDAVIDVRLPDRSRAEAA